MDSEEGRSDDDEIARPTAAEEEVIWRHRPIRPFCADFTFAEVTRIAAAVNNRLKRIKRLLESCLQLLSQ